MDENIGNTADNSSKNISTQHGTQKQVQTRESATDAMALLIICLAAGGVVLIIFIVCAVYLILHASRRMSTLENNTYEMARKTTEMVENVQVANQEGIIR